MTGWWHRRSLRARLLLIGSCGVAGALLVGGVGLYTVLTVLSYRTLDSAAAATAREVAGLAQAGHLPDPVPVTGDQVVQVVDSSNRVVSASNNADRLNALLSPADLRAAVRGEHLSVRGARLGRASDLRVEALAVPGSSAGLTVVVAQQVGDIRDSQEALVRTLLIIDPLLLVVLTLIASRVIGAVLRPVEALQTAADRISGAQSDASLPVPASDDEIRALALTLNSMLGRLSDARSRQRRFVADAAHELRSPLASMLTQLDVAAHLGEDSETTRGMRAEVDRMIGLVESLLVLAALDEVEPGPASEPVVLRPLVEEIVRSHPEPRARIESAVPELAVLVDEQGMRRVLDNLVTNALRHAESLVRVAAESSGGTTRLHVDDDGPGIGEEDRGRVFERFTRLDDSRTRETGGSGLGLAIVRELVEASGGRVRLGVSELGGLRVTCELPASPAAPLSTPSR